MVTGNFLPRCIAFELGIVYASIGIGTRLQNAIHLGKKFLAAIFSVIMHCILFHEMNECLFDFVFGLETVGGWAARQVVIL